MKVEIENPNKEQIQEYLNDIGWSLRPHGCNAWYLYNHNKKSTPFCLWFPETDARIESESKDSEFPKIVFYMKETVMEQLGNGEKTDCVCFRGKNDKSIFILCSNYN